MKTSKLLDGMQYQWKHIIVNSWFEQQIFLIYILM